MPKPSRNRQRRTAAYNEEPELGDGQTIGRIIQACGENTYEVQTEDGTERLYRLPKRLRFVAFIGRGTFVFLRDDPSMARGPSKLCGEIEVVILDHFLSSLRKKAYWPERFAASNTTQQPQPIHPAEEKPLKEQPQEKQIEEVEDDEQQEEEQEEDDWFVGMGNPNRDKWRDLACDDGSDDE